MFTDSNDAQIKPVRIVKWFWPVSSSAADDERRRYAQIARRKVLRNLLKHPLCQYTGFRLRPALQICSGPRLLPWSHGHYLGGLIRLCRQDIRCRWSGFPKGKTRKASSRNCNRLPPKYRERTGVSEQMKLMEPPRIQAFSNALLAPKPSPHLWADLSKAQSSFTSSRTSILCPLFRKFSLSVNGRHWGRKRTRNVYPPASSQCPLPLPICARCCLRYRSAI